MALTSTTMHPGQDAPGRDPRRLRRGLKDMSLDERGFSVVEAMASITLLMIFMIALLSSIIIYTRVTVENRTRNTASAVGSETAEAARSLAFSSLKVLDDGTVPNTFVDNGVTYQVAKGTPCPACLPYKTSVQRGGVRYDITQLVLEHASYTDPNGQVQTDKQLVVMVDWSIPRPATFRADTIIRNNDPVAAAKTQGVRIEVRDPVGDIIADPNARWAVTITGAISTVEGKTADGIFQSLALPAGSYTCTVSTSTIPATTSQDYHPEGDPTGNSVSETCAVAAGQVTLVDTTWDRSSFCAASGTLGAVNITITNSLGDPVGGATVVVTPSGSSTTFQQTTSSVGLASFNLAAGRYRFSASAFGYEPGSAAGSVCAYPGGMSEAEGTLTAAVPGQATLLVHVDNRDRNRTYRATVRDPLTGQQYVQTGTFEKDNVTKGKPKTITIPNIVFGTYNVTVCIVEGPNCNQLQVFLGQAFTKASPPYELNVTDAMGPP